MSFEKIISNIVALFKKAKIPYMLVGGIAVAYWGYPRQSLDIDIVADITQENADLFIKTAKKLGFAYNRQEIEKIIQIGNRFIMEQKEFRIDFWLPKSKAERNWLKNRKIKKVFGKKIFIIGPEDLILSKLLIGRARDQEDIKTILARQSKKLKKAYLHRQALSLNVLKSLNKLTKS